MRRIGGAKWLSWSISSVCAVGFLLWARHQPLPDPPTTPQAIAALILAIAACISATLWLCERWTALLRRGDRAFPRVEGYRSVVLGQIGNMCLPVRASEAIRVGIVTTASEKVTVRSSIGMLVAERALDIGWHVILLVVVCLGLFGPTAGGGLGRTPTIIAGLALLLASALVAIHFGGMVASRLKTGGRVSTFLAPVFVPLSGLRHDSKDLILLSCGFWLSQIVGWWAASWAVDLDLDPLQAAFVLAIATVALVAPVGFGAVGTLDAAIVFSVGAVGAPTIEVLGFVLLLRMMFILPSVLIASSLWLTRRFGIPIWDPHRVDRILTTQLQNALNK
jgi:glycosyltransferase 2 family protein